MKTESENKCRHCVLYGVITNMRKRKLSEMEKERNRLRSKTRIQKMPEQERCEYEKERYRRSKEKLSAKSEKEKSLEKEKKRISSKKYRENMTEEKRVLKRIEENNRRKLKYANLTKEEKEKKREYFSKWYEKNKKEYIKRVGKKFLERLKNDPVFRFQFRCNARMRSALHAQGGKKAHRTVDLLGCSPTELRRHLEKQFAPAMTWENYGTYWHVDHIFPCNAFDLNNLEQQRKCFHYTNLQPLEALQNIRKSDKIKTKENEGTLSDASIETILDS